MSFLLSLDQQGHRNRNTDDFYNDICTPYSYENSIDIPIFVFFDIILPPAIR